MSEHLLDVNEALKKVPVSRATLYRVIKRGQLRHIRIQSRILIRQGWLGQLIKRELSNAEQSDIGVNK